MPNFNNYSKYNHVFGPIHNKCNIYKKILKKRLLHFRQNLQRKKNIHKKNKISSVLQSCDAVYKILILSNNEGYPE